MGSFSRLDDIEIPDLEIDDGWPVSDVVTIQDCDDAFAFLMSAVAQIELQIDLEMLRPAEEQRGEWIARARCALKYKKAALQAVSNRRSAINDERRRLAHEGREVDIIARALLVMTAEQRDVFMAPYATAAAEVQS